MHRPNISIDYVLLPIFIISIAIGTALCQDGQDFSVASNQLILNIYIDDAGRALINGYADDPEALAFLNSSEYTYEDDSRQIYAITGALTSKFRNDWTVSFESEGSYEVYQILFYIPTNAKLSGMNSSSGLDYLVSTANESVIAEFRGSDVEDPAINIKYILPLTEMSKTDLDMANGVNSLDPYSIIALILIMGSGILIISFRPKMASSKPTAGLDHHVPTELQTSCEKPLDLSAPVRASPSIMLPVAPSDKEKDTIIKVFEATRTLMPDQKPRSGIEVTSETSAVMETLTDKERAVFKALLRREGVMTQTEIRYVVDISKSSLSGILTSMERRKIITKKEKGRTNVIELSERFLNDQE